MREDKAGVLGLNTNPTKAERWLPVVGWESAYEVSDLGRVRSLERFAEANYGLRKYGGQLVSAIKNSRGYLVVNLTFMGLRKQMFVHRLVLDAFVGIRPDGFDCCHNDGNKQNNALSNIRWDTRSANHADKRIHGTHLFGEKVGNSKIKESDVILIIKNKMNPREVVAKFGISRSQAKRIASGVSWVHVHAKQKQEVHDGR